MQEYKRKSFLSFILLLSGLIALTVATYAWFGISKTPSVSDFSLSATTGNVLEIAADKNGRPGEWSTVLDMSAILDNMVPLKPITYSNSEGAFKAPAYGIDGRPDFGQSVTLLDKVNANVKFASDTSSESEEQVASTPEGNQGYYAAIPLWLHNGGNDCTVYLTAPTDREKDVVGYGTFLVGKPVWNDASKSHTNGGNGTESAMRIGFGFESGGKQNMVIYEPNADLHNGDVTAYEATASVDGGATLVEEGRLITQGTNRWEEQSPILKDEVTYTTAQFLSSGSDLFSMKGGEKLKVTLYIWLEGQDVDCTNAISSGAILANVQFGAREENKGEKIVPR